MTSLDHVISTISIAKGLPFSAMVRLLLWDQEGHPPLPPSN